MNPHGRSNIVIEAARLRREGVITEKWCNRCETMKPTAEFYRNRSSRDGLTSYCQPCTREQQDEVRLLRRYGISNEQYEAMVEEQDGKCRICGGRPVRLYVDHNHFTGKVRALLCPPCNFLVGHLETSPDRISAAAAYIEEHRCGN